MMRFVWAVEGDDPDYGNCRANGITGIFAPMFDRLTDKMYLRRFIAEGFIPGLYVGHNWFPQLGPNELAAKVIAEYKKLTFASGEGDPALRDALRSLKAVSPRTPSRPTVYGHGPRRFSLPRGPRH